MAQLNNITTASTAISCAPYGTKWSNGKFSLLKKEVTGGGNAYLASDGTKSWYLDAKNAATFMNQHAITKANNTYYSIVPKATAPAQKKTPPDTKGAPKKTDKKTEKPKAEEEEEELPPQFDETDILISEISQGEFDQAQFRGYNDWRVRLALAPGSGYFYDGPNPGIMQPLRATGGVVFPYTPQIQVAYSANYNGIDITHSNYKVQQYVNSSVDQVSITCDFTAQDVFEARYLLAVIHFFRSMTKMFYGQDVYPIRGTPPPLCYIYGMGGYQFAAHPLGIQSFNYTLPADVDYIKTVANDTQLNYQVSDNVNNALVDIENELGSMEFEGMEWARLDTTKITKGGLPPPPKFNSLPSDITTWVPTKIQITIGCVPIMSRNQTANYFSLEDYASGRLIKGTSRPGGGFW